MREIKAVFLFILLLFLVNSKWTAKITTLDDQSLEYYDINKGFFTPLKLTLYKDQSPYKRLKTNLSLEDDTSFILSEENIKIDTHKSLSYIFYIGLKCNSRLKENSQYEINFQIKEENFNKEEEDLVLSPFTLKVKENKVKIEIEKTNSEISEGSFGYMFIKENFYNVDPFKITFKSMQDNEGDSQIETMSFNKFSSNSVNINEINFKYQCNKYNDFYSTQKYSFMVDHNSIMKNCFIIEDPVFQFDTNQKELPSIKENKKEILDSLDFSVEDQKEDLKYNEIVFKFKSFKVYPSIITCIAQSVTYKEDFPSNEEIRNYKQLIKGDKFSFYHKFINSTTDVNIKFKGLIRIETFRAKCLIENTSNKEGSDYIEFTIGNFEGSDFPLDLKTKKELTLNQICGEWTFDPWINNQRFSSLFNEKCNEMLNEVYEINGYYNNGCMECKSTEENLNKEIVKICLIPEANCNSDFNYDFSEKFKDLFSKVNTKEGILKEFNLQNYNVIKSRLIFNVEKPKEDLIKLSLVKKTNKDFEVMIENQNDLPINCYTQKIDKAEKVKLSPYFFDYNSKENEIKIKEKGILNLSFNFPDSTYDDNLYPLGLICYNSDNQFYIRDLTEPFSNLGVFKTNKTKEKDQPAPKNDCNKNRFNIECIKRKIHSLPDKNMYNIYSEFTSFKSLNEDEMRIFLDIKKEALKEITLSDTNINLFKEVTELLSVIDCNSFSNFGICIQYKKETMSFILSKINFSEIEALNFEDYLLLLFHLINSPDSYDKNSFNTIQSALQNLINNLEKNLENKEEKEKIKILNLVLNILSNSFDLLRFGEIEFNYKQSTPVLKNILIKSDIIDTFKNFLNSVISKYFSLTNDNFENDNIKIQSYILEDKFNNLRQLNELKIFGTNITLTFDEKSFYKQYPNHSILTVFYDYYPYVSINNTECWNSFIGLYLFDKSTKELSQPKLEEGLNLPQLHFVKFNKKYIYAFNDYDLDNSFIKETNTKEDELSATLTNFADFTLNSSEFISDIITKNFYKILLIIIIVITLIAIVVCLVCVSRVRNKKRMNTYLEQNFYNFQALIDEDLAKDKETPLRNLG